MAKKKQFIYDNDDIKAMLMEIGLEEDEAEREMEEFNIPNMIGAAFSAKTNEYAHIDSTGFAQVGNDDYDEKQKFERDYLKYRIFDLIGNPPTGSCLKWTANPHDFGTYHDIVYHFNDLDAKHQTYLEKLEAIDMEKMEAGCQSNWDAKQMGQPLGFVEYPHEDNEIFNLIEK